MPVPLRGEVTCLYLCWRVLSQRDLVLWLPDPGLWYRDLGLWCENWVSGSKTQFSGSETPVSVTENWAPWTNQQPVRTRKRRASPPNRYKLLPSIQGGRHGSQRHRRRAANPRRHPSRLQGGERSAGILPCSTSAGHPDGEAGDRYRVLRRRSADGPLRRPVRQPLLRCL